MEGLANYGSDDEATSSEESPQHPKELAGFEDTITISKKEPENDNYEDIGMDLSENGSSASPSHTPPSQSRNVTTIEKTDERKVLKDDSSSRSRGRRRSKRSRSASSRSRSKSRSRSRSKSRSRRRDDERRDKDKEKREKYRKERERDRGGSSRSYNRRRSRSRSRSRDKGSRDSRRHRENREREPRETRDARDSRDTRRDSREFPAGRYSKRFDRACNKLAHLEKMGIDVNKSQEKKDVGFYQSQPPAGQMPQNFVPAGAAAGGGASEDRLLPPGVTGRLREQMERRKALWQKKSEATDVQEVHTQGPNTSGKVWQATTFAHDQEGKQANKFKRLMGIRETPAPAGDKSTDSLAKKQEELFSSMEQQYEVARTATHTMRGVGLGFGSYQR